MVTIHIFWTMVEVGVALVAICLPLFRPGTLLRKNHWIQRWLGTSDSKPSHLRQPAKHSHRQSTPAADRSEHKSLVSVRVAEYRPNNLASANHDYHVAVESIPDAALESRKFKDRYAQFFPATNTSTVANATHVV